MTLTEFLVYECLYKEYGIITDNYELIEPKCYDTHLLRKIDKEAKKILSNINNDG